MSEVKNPKEIIDTAVEQFANILVALVENEQSNNPQKEDKGRVKKSD